MNTTILFGSRDGWLLGRLYDLRIALLGVSDAPRGVYFLTSRRAVTVPTIKSDADIHERFSSAPQGVSIGTFAAQRLGSECACNACVLRNSADEWRSYREYLRGLGLGGQRVVFVDWVTGGTIPKHLEELGLRVEALCAFAPRPQRYETAIGVRAWFGSASRYDECVPSLLRGGLLCEAVLTAPHGQLVRFASDGTPVFADDEDSHTAWTIVERVHAGVEDFMRDFVSLVGSGGISPGLADALFAATLDLGVAESIASELRKTDSFEFEATVRPLAPR